MFKELENSELFKGFDSEQIHNMLKKINYKIEEFSKGEVIAMEGENVESLGIVLSGEINVNKMYENGKQFQVKKIVCGDLIGHGFVFSDINYYSSTLISNDYSKILFISNENIIDLCMGNRKFLSNFVRLLSNQVIYLSERLKFISCGTIRQKIINYLLTEYKKQKTLKIKIFVTRKKMAEIFGVTRPALSNEMIRMKKEGLIKYKEDIIEIIDIYKLEEELEK
ncbi:Crp/Fnr family transcriptional regulator [Tepidibacter thalassicus]|uniref:cAMP-binding domain of CRP or a regulatory subunit of cAMP-dependent protein kinases n=1 Tax=Tepidibacter thalassicus DSM 15285 TaxID=1123350 RepID=A0A1M5NWX8_9FIRM|nr:Crp/Fnr family transcriptional regulator [Tepidibacter thalassicus]SHG94094.1 cAMP-binding domain of CRP or a regulatory subunit of cAMP-dependent protein kinases [Tepidibacter thalassicus DSM 15285]